MHANQPLKSNIFHKKRKLFRKQHYNNTDFQSLIVSDALLLKFFLKFDLRIFKKFKVLPHFLEIFVKIFDKNFLTNSATQLYLLITFLIFSHDFLQITIFFLPIFAKLTSPKLLVSLTYEFVQIRQLKTRYAVTCTCDRCLRTMH